MRCGRLSAARSNRGGCGGAGSSDGRILAYVFGRREDQAWLKLKAWLEPFGIRRYYTDGWGAYHRHVALYQHVVGKRRTQQRVWKKPGEILGTAAWEEPGMLLTLSCCSLPAPPLLGRL